MATVSQSLSPVATGRKVGEKKKKGKTLPIKSLGVIYALSSEACRINIQAFLSLQDILLKITE